MITSGTRPRDSMTLINRKCSFGGSIWVSNSKEGACEIGFVS